MRIVADTERCVGAGQCVLTQRVLFDQNDRDGTVVVRVDRVEPALLADARDAVRFCPSGALTLADG